MEPAARKTSDSMWFNLTELSFNMAGRSTNSKHGKEHPLEDKFQINTISCLWKYHEADKMPNHEKQYPLHWMWARKKIVDGARKNLVRTIKRDKKTEDARREPLSLGKKQDLVHREIRQN
ncbi:unnamed protein product [Dovyalis caffra]|uniref:Uncharacterized protein n=1 Tax=Dovyalis caffra TaxID=77055 RepID=A0AAV1S172_9ROSI|nr:unnamed protein product [Dovyalis caffra]